MATFSDSLKNIFWFMILLQVAPPLFKNIKTQYEDLLEPATKVGIINIKGDLTSASSYVKELKKLFEDDEIKALVLKIDSPGGASGTAQTIFNELKYFKSQYSDKFTVAWIENIAASGGYYIASAAHTIIASPSAFIGNIGAYIPHPYIKEFLDQYKLKYEIISTGEYKTAGSPFLPLTDAQRAELQGLTDNVYHQFIEDVLEQRPQLPKDSKKWADGRIFTGQQAAKLKLIDTVGSPSTVIKTIRKNAQIEGKIEWVTATKSKGLLATLLSSGQEDDQNSYLKSLIITVCRVVESRYAQRSVQL